MLFGSNILEIAIGLTFLYVLLALICSTLNEWIAGLFSLRARTLREGIANLLEDPDAQGLAKQFFEHPLVRGLARNGKNDFPSYISARTFASALLDITFPEDGGAGPTNTLDLYERLRARLTDLSASNSGLAKTMLILLNQAGIDPQKIKEASSALQQVEQVRTSLLALAGNLDAAQLGASAPLAETLVKYQQLETTLKQAEDKATVALAQAQDNVERYYDQAMERVSGWYKRKAQVIIIVLAVIVTGLLNADTILIANRLALDPVLRSKIADAATAYVQPQNEEPTPAVSTSTTAPAQETGANTVSTTASSGTVASTATATASTSLAQSTQLSQTLATLTGLGLPLGWTEMPQTPQGWVYKLVGLLITVVAVSLGAPFWFQLLNRLVNLRMTGGKPEPASPAPDSPTSSVLEARLLPGLRTSPPGFMAGAIPHDTLAELAVRAVKYVEELKQSRSLTVPDRDVAMAWMVVETTNRNIAVSPDELVSAVDQAFKERS